MRGSVSEKDEDRKWDEGCVSGGSSARQPQASCFILEPRYMPPKPAGPNADKLPPKALSSTAMSLPLFFEPNQGQTAPQVKFLARGAGYGLFLTADEAVLELRERQHSAFSGQLSALSSQLSACFQFGDSHAARRSQLVGPRFRRFASAGEEQLFYWQ